jgi:hypothetical protein
MPNNNPSSKRAMIDKANARTVAYVGVAAFIVIFSLVSTKTLISQATYQNHVISAKKVAVKQLKADLAATKPLMASYSAFVGTSQNVLGGNSDAVGRNDGNNAKIVLDALPSSYDFPGLTNSIETLLNTQGVGLQTITGTDDEVAQSANQSSVTPQPIPIPFGFGVNGDYTAVQKTISALEHSTRPMQVQTLDIAGSNGKLQLNVTAQTYYQPAKSLNINQKVVK